MEGLTPTISPRESVIYITGTERLYRVDILVDFGSKMACRSSNIHQNKPAKYVRSFIKGNISAKICHYFKSGFV